MSRKHRTLIGVDEAGYGPRLGPLVVALTAFRVPLDCVDLRELIFPDGEPPGIRVDDSKRVYRGGHGLGTLERSVLAFKGCCEAPEVPDPLAAPRAWERANDSALPVACLAEGVAEAETAVAEALSNCGVTLLGMATRTVPVEVFNREVERRGSKARVLFDVAMNLAGPWIGGQGDVQAIFDRHGGRAYYSGLLAEAFPERYHWVVEETRRCSTYRFPGESGEARVSFEVEADRRHLPAALASMCAKYVRELHMRAFNSYFAAADPDLKPTAGYAQDAARWLADSADLRLQLGLNDEELIRNR